MQKLTMQQAVVLSGYTGFLACPFPVLHAEIEKRLGGGVFTHMLGDRKFVEETVMPTFKADFKAMCPMDEVEPKPTRYVCGFNFSCGFKFVTLIRKARPRWQAGKLNGVGGHIEGNELPEEAMAREFMEEAGGKTGTCQWKHFLTMAGDNDAGTGPFSVEFFARVGGYEDFGFRSEGEPIELVPVESLHPLATGCVENVPWLVGLAIDHMRDNRPTFATIDYRN